MGLQDDGLSWEGARFAGLAAPVTGMSEFPGELSRARRDQPDAES